VPKTLDYPTTNLNLRKRAPYDHIARPSQTDGRTDRQADKETDEHHGTIARRFVLTNALRAKKRTVKDDGISGTVVS